MRFLVVLALGASGCLVSADYGGTGFSCARDGLCPDGFVCEAGRCVAAGGGPDGGPDAPEAPGEVRHLITVDHGAGAAALQDFPLPLFLDGDRIDVSSVAAGGADLRFLDELGAPLAHEIEGWEDGVGGLLWVRVPSIEAAADGARFYVHYGGEAGSPDADAVWSDYAAVYHLADATDSSPSGFDGVESNAVPVPGVLGDACRFAGAGSYIDLGTDRPFVRAQPAATVSAWVRIDAANVLPSAVFATSINSGGEPTNASRLQILIDPDGRLEGGARSLDEGGIITVTGPSLATGTRIHLAVAVDFAGDRMELFVDGTSVAAGTALGLGPTSADTDSTQTVIGAGELLDEIDSFVGEIDEVRLFHGFLDPDWIAAEARAALDQVVTVGPAEPL
jgi:hypothetical protein